MRFALVNNNKVLNVIEANYDIANKIASLSQSIAVEVMQYPIQLQDEYRDGEFYRNNIKIKKTLTEKESIREDIEIIAETFGYLVEEIDRLNAELEVFKHGEIMGD